MKRVILFQPSSIHIEVLRPQIDFLLNQFDITVVTTQKVRESDAFESLPNSENLHYSLIPDRIDFPGSKYIIRIFRYLALFSLLFRKKDYILFNTLSKRDIYFSSVLKKRSKLIGIIHNVEKLKDDKYSSYLNNFDKLLVLSDEVYNYCTTKKILGDVSEKLDWFIPLLVDLQKHLEMNVTVSKNGPVTIGVVGSVSQDRRDYNSLWNALRRLLAEGYKVDEIPFRIVLAGRIKESILESLPKEIIPLLKYSTNFIQFSEINQMISSCDLMAYLIHPSLTFGNDYNKTKISGTSTILKSIPVVPISSDCFNIDVSYRDVAYFYSESDIYEFLQRTLSSEITKKTIIERKGLINISDYSFETQKRRYLSFLNSSELEISK